MYLERLIAADFSGVALPSIAWVEHLARDGNIAIMDENITALSLDFDVQRVPARVWADPAGPAKKKHKTSGGVVALTGLGPDMPAELATQTLSILNSEASSNKKARRWNALLPLAPGLIDDSDLKLGCPKCRQSKLGCRQCRQKAGLVEDVELGVWRQKLRADESAAAEPCAEDLPEVTAPQPRAWRRRIKSKGPCMKRPSGADCG